MPVESSPAIGDDGTIYFCSDDSYIYAIYSNTGKLKWHFPTGDTVTSSPVIGYDRTIYVGSANGYIYVINGE
jgi:outer membrane protein assembly factor BamB